MQTFRGTCIKSLKHTVVELIFTIEMDLIKTSVTFFLITTYNFNSHFAFLFPICSTHSVLLLHRRNLSKVPFYSIQPLLQSVFNFNSIWLSAGHLPQCLLNLMKTLTNPSHRLAIYFSGLTGKLMRSLFQCSLNTCILEKAMPKSPKTYITKLFMKDAFYDFCLKGINYCQNTLTDIIVQIM